MRAYLITTGSLFALLTLVHILRVIDEWPRVHSDPSFVLTMTGLSALTAALSIWAWRLLRTPAR